MKTALLCLLLAGFAAACFADGAIKQTTKISKGSLSCSTPIKSKQEAARDTQGPDALA